MKRALVSTCLLVLVASGCSHSEDLTRPSTQDNFAVAYEANGEFENARKEYLEALKLDKSNQYIQKNYSRYVEFLSRNKKRQQQKPGATPAPGAAPAPAPASPATPAAGTAPTPPKPAMPRADQPSPPPS